MAESEYHEMEKAFFDNFSTGKAKIHLWPYTHYKHLNCGCIYKNKFVAVLDSPLVNDLPTPSQMAIYENAAAIFVVAMKCQNMLKSAENQPMHTFLASLVSGRINFDFQKLDMREAIFDTTKQFQLVWLLTRDGADREQLEPILNNFCAAQKNWWCVPHEDGFVILLVPGESGALQKLTDIFIERLRMCVSDEFSNLRDTALHLDLARMALRYAAYANEQKNMVTVDNYKAIIAYSYAHANSGLRIFSNNIIENMKEYDQKYGTQFLETLRVCIHYNHDTRLMAQKLKIHKNTVFYRLRQMNELFGFDLKNVQQQANLLLALCIEYHK